MFKRRQWNAPISAGLILAVALCLQPAKAGDSRRVVRDKWALLVGISKFKDQSINLKYPAKDAQDFAKFLINEEHFAPDHVKILTDEKANREGILDAMGDKWLPRVAGPDDLVLIYISTHGSPSTLDLGGINYIVAYDTDKERLYSTGIAMQDLSRIIKGRVHSDRVVILLDACHSGATSMNDQKGISRHGNFDAGEIAQGTGQLVICSSDTTQVSWESKRTANSVFTNHLMKALRVNGDRTTLGQAFSSMKTAVEEEVRRDRGGMQTPVLKGVWQGDELMVAVPPSKPGPGLEDENLASNTPEPVARTNTAAEQLAALDAAASSAPESVPVSAAPPPHPQTVIAKVTAGQPLFIRTVVKEGQPTPDEDAMAAMSLQREQQAISKSQAQSQGIVQPTKVMQSVSEVAQPTVLASAGVAPTLKEAPPISQPEQLPATKSAGLPSASGTRSVAPLVAVLPFSGPDEKKCKGGLMYAMRSGGYKLPRESDFDSLPEVLRASISHQLKLSLGDKVLGPKEIAELKTAGGSNAPYMVRNAAMMSGAQFVIEGGVEFVEFDGDDLFGNKYEISFSIDVLDSSSKKRVYSIKEKTIEGRVGGSKDPLSAIYEDVVPKAVKPIVEKILAKIQGPAKH